VLVGLELAAAKTTGTNASSHSSGLRRISFNSCFIGSFSHCFPTPRKSCSSPLRRGVNPYGWAVLLWPFGCEWVITPPPSQYFRHDSTARRLRRSIALPTPSGNFKPGIRLADDHDKQTARVAAPAMDSIHLDAPLGPQMRPSSLFEKHQQHNCCSVDRRCHCSHRSGSTAYRTTSRDACPATASRGRTVPSCCEPRL
jgi:hypothetical protein